MRESEGIMNKEPNPFAVTNEEYGELEKEFVDLCRFQSWQLLKKNSRNNHTDAFDDILQDTKMAMLVAGLYYKRQVYIEECLKTAKKHIVDPFLKLILKELSVLWDNRKRHGANRRKFGAYQERLLDRLIYDLVPEMEQPSKKAPLRFDKKFKNYCKSITWNTIKTKGKKITREKEIRSGLVSLSDYDYLVTS